MILNGLWNFLNIVESEKIIVSVEICVSGFNDCCEGRDDLCQARFRWGWGRV